MPGLKALLISLSPRLPSKETQIQVQLCYLRAIKTSLDDHLKLDEMQQRQSIQSTNFPRHMISVTRSSPSVLLKEPAIANATFIPISNF